MLFQAERQITHVLLTRAPLYSDRSPFALDLHVLGAPPTFALSQDQTLQLAFCDTLIFEAPNLSLSLDSEELTQEPTNLLLSVCYSVFKDRSVSTVTFVSRPALRPFVSEGARTIFRFRRPVNYFFRSVAFFSAPHSPLPARSVSPVGDGAVSIATHGAPQEEISDRAHFCDGQGAVGPARRSRRTVGVDGRQVAISSGNDASGRPAARCEREATPPCGLEFTGLSVPTVPRTAGV